MYVKPSSKYYREGLSGLAFKARLSQTSPFLLRKKKPKIVFCRIKYYLLIVHIICKREFGEILQWNQHAILDIEVTRVGIVLSFGFPVLMNYRYLKLVEFGKNTNRLSNAA